MNARGKACARVASLSKKYRIGQTVDRYGRLTEVLWHSLRPKVRLAGGRDAETYFWALRDVSFDIQEGEVVGIIGRNGAGKTTLLKILSRITEPTAGMVELKGRVSSLLEVGTGFHPELTGKENVYLNAAILGMKKADTRRRFDEIVAFAGVDKFLDTPVKRYSTGMYVRLAFAVAAHLEPEILLVDEVLSVGDAEFQKKCLGKMSDVAKEGRTVIFVSHQMNSVRRLCDRSIWLDSGMVKKEGPTAQVVAAYESGTRTTNGHSSARQAAPGQTRFLRWELVEAAADEPNCLNHFGPFAIRVGVQVAKPISRGRNGIALRNSDGQLMWAWAADKIQVDPGIREFIYSLPHLPLRPGAYFWHFSLSDDSEILDQWESSPPLVIATDSLTHPRDEWNGFLNIPCELKVR